MADDLHNDEQRPRASLRGKGRHILLGQQSADETSSENPRASAGSPARVPPADEKPDATALDLTPEEAGTLLDFSPDSPAYRPDYTFTTAPKAVKPTPVPADDAADELPAWLREDAPPSPGLTPLADDDLDVDETYQFDVSEASPLASVSVDEGLPIAERIHEADEHFFQRPYEPQSAVEELTPYTTPEEWVEPEIGEPDLEDTVVLGMPSDTLTDFQPAAPDDEGGVYVPLPEKPATEVTAPTSIGDPFPALRRKASDELFHTTPPTDKGMLDTLVDDDRVQKLWMQIEAVHEDLVESVHGDRTATDEYQRELLQASGMLLESRENYDDARAIVYRIRADLNRQRKVEADVNRYRPLLLNYYIGWGVALVVLFLLKQLFAGVAEAVGVDVFAALYYPILLGIVGALVSGYMTLDRHTTKLRDFDPMHITWYLFNPLLGGVMGLLMFLLASIANEDLLQESASQGEMAITYLLCVIAGMNQGNVLRRLNELMDRFGSGSSK